MDFTPTELLGLRRLLSASGLSVPSFMPAFFRYPHNLSSPNDVVREDSLNYMRQCLDNAVALGAETLLIVPGRRLHGQSFEDAFTRLVDSVAKISDYAARVEIRLAIEPVNRYVSDLINTAEDARRIIDLVGYSKLGVVLDTGHINLGNESPQQAIQEVGDRLFQVHVNDNDGRQQQNLTLGEGSFDFTSFLQSLQRIGYDGYLTAELAWEYTLDPDPVVIQTAQLMRKLIQGSQCC